MNDQFLHDLRKEPRQEFSSVLFSEINARFPASQNNHHFAGNRWAIGIVSLVLLATLTFVLVPPAKALAIELLRKVGILTVEEQDSSLVSHGAGASERISISEPEARELFQIPFNLPTWVPEEFSLEPQFSRNNQPVDVAEQVLHIQWKSDRGYIDMTIIPYSEKWKTRYENHIEKVGPGSVEEADINGYPAALISGGWYSESFPADGDEVTSTWSFEPGRGSLIWAQDELIYVMYWSPTPDTQFPLQNDEMVRMAESIP